MSTPEQGLSAARELADQREIDAQVRVSEADLECDQLRNEQRSIIERKILADERDDVADARELRLDAREQQLDDEERRTHTHQLDLADRVEQDDRDRTQPVEHLLATGPVQSNRTRCIPTGRAPAVEDS